MEFSILHRSSSIILLLLLSGVVYPVPASSIGINYGQIGDNLPSPEDAVVLVKSIGATKVKLYDANPRILKAFANTGVEFIVGLGNEFLSTMKDPHKALIWIRENVQPYLPATSITCITIGNEVLTLDDADLTENLLPAMKGVHAALVSLGLDKNVSVTTAHSLGILATSFPPSAGEFRQDLEDFIVPILEFHRKSGSPFLINAYPFFAYKANPNQVSLNFVLFQPNEGIIDPATNLRYDNMLYAQIDAAYSALAAAGYRSLPVEISETGWPSKGDSDEVGATSDNAKKYNGNLIKMMTSNKTNTPLRPDCDLNIYIFALFNENMKPGPTSERNYGLFKPDGTPAYSLGFTVNNTVSGNSTGNSRSAGGSTDGDGDESSGKAPADPETSSTAYLSISSSAGRKEYIKALLISSILLLAKADFLKVWLEISLRWAKEEKTEK